MNYIKLINNYWQLREQGILDAGCGDLYLYLLNKSNTLGWKNPFNQSNSIVRSVISVSEPTLIRQRNVLKQLGLIEFESGKATRQNTSYYLNDFSSDVSSVVSSSVSSVFSRDVIKHLDYIKHKQNKTKQKDNTKVLSKQTFFENVFLTDLEFEKLKTEFTDEITNEAILFLSNYKKEKGYKTKDDNLTIRRWVVKAVKEQKEKSCAKKESKVDSSIASYNKGLQLIEQRYGTSINDS